MSRKVSIALIVILVLCVVGAVMAGAVVLLMRMGPTGADRVALIRVEGVITSGRGSGDFFGGATAGAERIVKLLERFRKDKSAKSLVVRINSPGGSAAGSQEIYQGIMRVRHADKKVIVSMGDVAASGGYYVASAADKIYADPATLTGSIGVIMETVDLHELLSRVGISLGAVKSGKHKDIGSPSRPMTSEERKIVQALIDDVFDQFVADVSAGRKLPKEYVRKLADGRIYTGRQALELKLVDKTGTLEDALKAAALEAGIKGEFEVTEYEQRYGLFDMLFGGLDAGSYSWLRGPGSLGDSARRLLQADSEIELR